MKKYEFSVIVPIYNGSSYLEETLQSIVNQTIGFKDNIELILVNDGSSEEEVDTICKKYESNYKENVIYIKKENGGVSSARNEGLNHVHGKYINFFDADDKWEADAFEKVKKAFDKNEVSIVCCRQKFFDAKEGYQTLDYRFDKGNHISNIFEEPKNILLSVTNTFFKREAIENHQFNEKLKYGEDARFVIEVVLETENIMFLKDAVNEFRRRSDYTSATQNKKSRKTTYIETIEDYYKYVVKLSKQKYKKVIPFIQYTILNGVKHRICESIPNVLNKEELKKYKEDLLYLLDNIEEKTILNVEKTTAQMKAYLLYVKDNYSYEKLTVRNNGIFYKGQLISKFSNICKIEKVIMKRKKFYVSGYINKLHFLRNYEIKLEYNNELYDIEIDDVLEVRKTFNDEEYLRKGTFELIIDLEKNIDDFDIVLVNNEEKYKILSKKLNRKSIIKRALSKVKRVAKRIINKERYDI